VWRWTEKASSMQQKSKECALKFGPAPDRLIFKNVGCNRLYRQKSTYSTALTVLDGDRACFLKSSMNIFVGGKFRSEHFRQIS
jgi:hypothetical protein